MDEFSADTQTIQDALALKEIRQTAGFAALLRLMKRSGDDLFDSWSDDKADVKFTKDYCRGQLDLIKTFAATVDEMIREGESLVESREEETRMTRTAGGGELAL